MLAIVSDKRCAPPHLHPSGRYYLDMLSNVSIAGSCPKCQAQRLACRYNYFDRGDLQIHAWEHKCSECGWRETKAFRSDDAVPATEADAARCPLCGRTGG